VALRFGSLSLLGSFSVKIIPSTHHLLLYKVSNFLKQLTSWKLNHVCTSRVFNRHLVIFRCYNSIFTFVGKLVLHTSDLLFLLTHCRRVTQICVFNTVKLGTCKFSLVPLHKEECFQRYHTLKYY